MAAHVEEIITTNEVFANAKKAFVINPTMDKAIEIYLEHWVDLKALRVVDMKRKFLSCIVMCHIKDCDVY